MSGMPSCRLQFRSKELQHCRNAVSSHRFSFLVDYPEFFRPEVRFATLWSVLLFG